MAEEGAERDGGGLDGGKVWRGKMSVISSNDAVPRSDKGAVEAVGKSRRKSVASSSLSSMPSLRQP